MVRNSQEKRWPVSQQNRLEQLFNAVDELKKDLQTGLQSDREQWRLNEGTLHRGDRIMLDNVSDFFVTFYESIPATQWQISLETGEQVRGYCNANLKEVV